MPITLTCDKCDRLFQVDDADAGGRAACPYCGDVRRIPAAAAPAAARLRSAAQTSRAPAVGGEGEDEVTLAVVRQAMFRAHPFIYSLVVLVFIGGLVFAGLAAASVVAAWMAPAGLIASGVAALTMLAWWLAPHRWTTLTITSRRTIRQEGIVMRKTSEVLHHHVTNVIIEQGLLQRLLGVGYIGLDTAGQGGASGASGHRSGIEIEVWNVPHPYEIKALIDRYRLGA